MRETRRVLLNMLDIMEHVSYLEQFVADGYEHFMRDIKTQFAVRLAYEVIGDMVKQIPLDLLAQYPQVAWRSLKGMRDILAHRYFELDMEEIWRATFDTPNLRAVVQAMLGQPATRRRRSLAMWC